MEGGVFWMVGWVFSDGRMCILDGRVSNLKVGVYCLRDECVFMEGRVAGEEGREFSVCAARRKNAWGTPYDSPLRYEMGVDRSTDRLLWLMRDGEMKAQRLPSPLESIPMGSRSVERCVGVRVVDEWRAR